MSKKESIFKKNKIGEEVWTYEEWEMYADSHSVNYIEMGDVKEYTDIIPSVDTIICRCSPSYKEYPWNCFFSQLYQGESKYQSKSLGKVVEGIESLVLDEDAKFISANGDTGGDYLYFEIVYGANKLQDCKVGKTENDYTVVRCEKSKKPIVLRKELSKPKTRI